MIMENGISAGELALLENRRYGYGYGDCGCGCNGYHNRNGVAATGLALGASGLGIAIFGGLAIAYGLNAASKARARGAENAINQQSKTMEVLAGVVNREATRADGINIDVNQTLRSLTAASAQGGSASANSLALAEALAIASNNGSGLNSAVGGCNYLRVARVSGSRLCGCENSCCGEG